MSGGNKEAFDREALIWTTIPPHPYIVSCETVDHIANAPLIWLEYAEGGSLRERLASSKLPLVEVLRLCRELCVAMQYLFSTAKILHRDIKPGNLLLTAEGSLKVTDFGLASLQQYGLQLLSTTTGAGAESALAHSDRFVGGTLPYMSPEHFGEGEMTTASDIYSVGVVMHEMLQAILPFDCTTVEEFRRSHLSKAPANVSSDRAPPSVSAIVGKCLQKDPSRRFADFAELHDAITEVVVKERLAVPEPKNPTARQLEDAIDGFGWNKRGYAFARLSRFEESLRCYQMAWEAGPENVAVNQNMGIALDRVGRDEEALPYYEKEVALHGDAPLAWAALATAYAKRGRPAEAIRHMESAANTGERPNVFILRQLCALYREASRDADYGKCVQRIYDEMDSGPDRYHASGWVNEGLHFGLMGELMTSLRFFDEAVRRFPRDTDGWYNRAVTLLFLGKIDRAKRSIANALAYDSKLPHARFLLGIILLAEGDTVNAVTEWQRVRVSDPDHLFSRLVPNFVSLASAAGPEMALRLISGVMNVSRLYMR